MLRHCRPHRRSVSFLPGTLAGRLNARDRDQSSQGFYYLSNDKRGKNKQTGAMAGTANITAETTKTNQADALHRDLDSLCPDNHPPRLSPALISSPTSLLFLRLLSCVTTFCMHELFTLTNTAPGVRSDHLIGAPTYLAVNTQICLSPCPSFRHWQPCIPFRLHSTYTRPPYPGATPSSPPPLHHLRTFSLLAPFANLCITSLPARIFVACAHTRHLQTKHRGISLPGVIHLTRWSFTGLG